MSCDKVTNYKEQIISKSGKLEANVLALKTFTCALIRQLQV